jgi:PKD repeat protein
VSPASPLAASFTFSPASPAAGQAVQFTDTSTGGPTSWQWSFGDGGTSTAQNPSHTFTTAGSYTVSLIAANGSSSQSASRTVTVVSALVASFTFSPASPAAGQAVQFTDTSTGGPTSWQWNFGDGATSTSQNPSHTFATAASYTVVLTVTNSSGSKNVSRTVTVVPALAASFTFSPASPAAGQAVQFTDTSTGGPTSWQWNFGDGGTSTAQNPSHTYASSGSYTIVLTVRNTSGSTSATQVISVLPSPTFAASFTYSPASPAAGQAVQFTDTSTGGPTSWQWNFGDGTASTAQNPSHIYETPAAYTVTLTARNSSYSDIAVQTLNVTSVTDIIPPDRRIDWKPGIEGGIPTYPVAINVKNSPYNARGDGISNDTAAIQQAIANCPSRSAVYLPAGTYRLTSQLSIGTKSIVLRGDGPGRTFLKSESGGQGISIAEESGPILSRGLSSGYTKGSTTITVSSVSGLSVGNYILVNQTNDPSVCEDMHSYQYDAIAQMVKITAISGNTLTINRPLYYTYSASFSPKVEKYACVEGAGVEDLYIEMVNAADASIRLWAAANCWVKNVESYNAGAAHVRLKECYACVVRSSYFHHAHGYAGSEGYGVFLFGRNTDNLIEDNILYHLRHGVTIEWGGCGNVIAYNYATRFYDESYPNTDWLMESLHAHGGHPYMNLFEGNICPNVVFDNAIGSSRHNTAFRNHAERYSQGASLNLNAIEVQMNNLYENVIGNVLCRPGDTGSYEVQSSARGVYKLGCNQSDCSAPDPRSKATLLRHGNFDYVTGTTHWDPAIEERNLPNSYYLTSKPSFFGTLPWPMIGPDLSPMVGDLPAKMRFEGKTVPQPPGKKL